MKERIKERLEEEEEEDSSYLVLAVASLVFILVAREVFAVALIATSSLYQLLFLYLAL